MTTVFVTQIPSKRDPETGKWKPVIDISSAKEFGRIEILSQPGTTRFHLGETIRIFEQQLGGFAEGDYLLPIGNPLLVVAASAYLSKRFDRFDVLKWDRKLCKYFSYEVNITTVGGNDNGTAV